MSRLIATDLPLPGLKSIAWRRLGDGRGFFARLFCAEELRPAGWGKPIAQINLSHTVLAGTVRGLHWQAPPHAEMKLVICLRGAVWDVAVDLRAGSPTFRRWHGERLSAEQGGALLIPEGFAHGFQTLTEDVELLYCHSHPYVPEAEAGADPLDPSLAIPWPLPIAMLSERDRGLPRLGDDFPGVIP